MSGRAVPSRRNRSGVQASPGAAVLAAAFGMIAVAGCVIPANSAPSLEWAVKAAYLFKLPPFIEWPGNAFASSSSPFNLCIVGSDPFGDLLERGAAGQKLGEHPIVIQHLSDVSQGTHCQMMYVAGDPQAVAADIGSTGGMPVLTITDSQTDGRAKGIINFVTRDNHVRFEIDRAAAARDRLHISSKLLSIAVPAEQDRGPP
jgi:hypothetical protein